MTYKKNSAGLQLESANFGDGVIRVTGSNSSQSEVDYFLTDHLGRVRVIVDDAGLVKERNDYYPFGARHVRGDYPKMDNRLLYNGKEEQVTGDLDYLDYGWRMYDSGLGRWFGMDPLAEKYYSLSSYIYCANNPLRYIDPDGKDLWLMLPNGEIILALVTSERNAIYILDKSGNISAGFLGSNNDMFVQLSHPADYNRKRTSIMPYSHKDEMKGLFYFMADNTEVEWSFAISTRNEVGIATRNYNFQTPFAFESEDIRYGIHSHVGTTDLKDEVEGLYGDIEIRKNGYYPFDYNIYMKNSGNLYQLDNMNRERIIKTMDLNTYLYQNNGIFKGNHNLYSEKESRKAQRLGGFWIFTD